MMEISPEPRLFLFAFARKATAWKTEAYPGKPVEDTDIPFSRKLEKRLERSLVSPSPFMRGHQRLPDACPPKTISYLLVSLQRQFQNPYSLGIYNTFCTWCFLLFYIAFFGIYHEFAVQNTSLIHVSARLGWLQPARPSVLRPDSTVRTKYMR
jgi:hypothetical protein